ncbi:endo alpha-1,4 polygalactosaminidase [Patulibacter minatonensis]|uniref:endo alpha-1,4 polygalactosaminidase n=1 Tax=Patulibacter minatonensis TaxID=298163 RepID=UPI0004BC73D3|nr:endo alpha-1,4 polygalactosaminidase [Patulibacter minatonensis]
MNGPGTPRRRSRIRAIGQAGGAVVGISLLGVLLSAASTRPAVGTRSAASTTPAAQLPPGNVGFDLQLGGSYAVPADAGVVERDRTSVAPAGAYGVCYVNGFQTQDSEISWWRRRHPELLLKVKGREVRDPNWPETVLDVSTAARRKALASIVGGWIDGCARKGFRGVEFDNLDSWTRSRGRLTRSDSEAMGRLLVARAHRAGLAAGQKNAAELIRGAKRPLGFDFAVVEECQQYAECGRYTRAYGDRVFEVEYDRARFKAACAARGATLSVLLRDRDLVREGEPGYVRESC